MARIALAVAIAVTDGRWAKRVATVICSKGAAAATMCVTAPTWSTLADNLAFACAGAVTTAGCAISAIRSCAFTKRSKMRVAAGAGSAATLAMAVTQVATVKCSSCSCWRSATLLQAVLCGKAIRLTLAVIALKARLAVTCSADQAAPTARAQAWASLTAGTAAA